MCFVRQSRMYRGSCGTATTKERDHKHTLIQLHLWFIDIFECRIYIHYLFVSTFIFDNISFFPIFISYYNQCKNYCMYRQWKFSREMKKRKFSPLVEICRCTTISNVDLSTTWPTDTLYCRCRLSISSRKPWWRQCVRRIVWWGHPSLKVTTFWGCGRFSAPWWRDLDRRAIFRSEMADYNDDDKKRNELYESGMIEFVELQNKIWFLPILQRETVENWEILEFSFD